MAIAEGRTLPFVGPEHIDVAVLETFDYDGPEQEIATETGEFTAVCPYSGLPDFARLTITYVPGRKCVELKSLKYYVTSFRNVGIFQEHAHPAELFVPGIEQLVDRKREELAK